MVKRKKRIHELQSQVYKLTQLIERYQKHNTELQNRTAMLALTVIRARQTLENLK